MCEVQVAVCLLNMNALLLLLSHINFLEQKEPTASPTSIQLPIDFAALEELRAAAPKQDDDGQPLWPEATDPTRPIGPGNPPRRKQGQKNTPRATVGEIENRIAEAQLWIAQRLPMVMVFENARTRWGIVNHETVRRYMHTARERMVTDLISDRKRHQAEQIYALNELARNAAKCKQYNAAVGAYRVIAEIGGMLRAPLKAPEAKH